MSSQRYTRLSEVYQNKWLIGCPIEIVKGALLIDNQSQNIILQLKLRNVSELRLKHVNLRVYRFDGAGDSISSLEDPMSSELSDLNIQCKNTFGDNIAINLGVNTTRKVKIVFNKIVFQNDEVWRNDEEIEGESFNLKGISNILNNNLSLQFGRECDAMYTKFNYSEQVTVHNFIPEKNTNDWICTCGFPNSIKSSSCGRCGLHIIWLLKTIDGTYIANRLEEYLEVEKIRLDKLQKEQTQQHEKQRSIKNYNKKLFIILLVIILVCSVGYYFALTAIIPDSKYNKAKKLMDNGNYAEAVITFKALTNFKDSETYYKESNYRIALKLIEEKNYSKASMILLQDINYKDSSTKYLLMINEKVISTSLFHTVGLKKDGTVVAVGGNSNQKWDVSSWKDIESVTTGDTQAVGLKKDGTVVAVGGDSQQWGVSSWKDIVAVSAGHSHIVGLKKDGTVVAVEVGENKNQQWDVSSWEDIIAVTAGYSHIVGLKKDGTVVAVGGNNNGQCDVSSWKDIVSVTAGETHTIGLEKDGTVVAIGWYNNQKCDVSSWKDIIAVSAGSNYTVGLRKDGTVVTDGDISDKQCDTSSWTDIIAVSAGANHTVGVRTDGTVVAVGENNYKQCDVSSWTDIG